MAFNRNRYKKDGFIDLNSLKFNDEMVYIYIVPLKYEGRPDLISLDIYGDTSYQVFLSYFNKIKNTPEDYTVGKKIKYIRKNLLE